MDAKMWNHSIWIPETDPLKLKAFCNDLLEKSEFIVISYQEHKFRPVGFTGLWLLAESHLAVHTFPQNKKTYLELSSCSLEKYVTFVQLLNGQEYKPKPRVKAEKDADVLHNVTLVVEYLNLKTQREGVEKYNPKGNEVYKLISARLKTHSVDDCKRVIDVKVADWFGTTMQKYLRVATLFNPTNFMEYLAQKPNPVQASVNPTDKTATKNIDYG